MEALAKSTSEFFSNKKVHAIVEKCKSKAVQRSK